MAQGRDPDERDLFAEAMADVRPLEHNMRTPELVPRTPVPLSERDREVLDELDALCAGTQPLDPADTDEYLEGAVHGLDPRVRRRLRRGEFTIQAELDLHGVDAESAGRLLQAFLQECHAHALRVVRVVHGRGRNSPGGIPVLKASFPRWLARGASRRIVLAYATATLADGGAGASYVLLRRGR